MDYAWLPKVDKLLAVAEGDGAEYNRPLLAAAARETVEALRRELPDYPSREALFQAAYQAMLKRYRQKRQPSLRRVINATGVVLHTNLGRSPLAAEAVAAVAAAAGYGNVELELASGKRSSRYDHVTPLLRELTGAEDALVVNNNAGAVLLVLDTMARGREAVVSRGQLVEIGGSFRVPDIMEKSGARLVEVGTTNKTHLRDYAAAISEQTALLMLVHTSNFRIIGFTEQVELKDLMALSRERGVPVLDDLGSGCLYPLAAQGIGTEPLVAELMKSGVDVVTFSGDKLLGGPQAGIIVGKQEYIARIKENPLTRALRVDKFTLAALEATLRIYQQGRERQDIPALAMILAPAEELRPKAERLATLLRQGDPQERRYRLQVRQAVSEAGGGSLPGVELPTWVVQVEPLAGKSAALLTALRQGSPAALGYIREDAAMFDVRTLAEEELPELARLIDACCGGGEGEN